LQGRSIVGKTGTSFINGVFIINSGSLPETAGEVALDLASPGVKRYLGNRPALNQYPRGAKIAHMLLAELEVSQSAFRLRVVLKN
jgi:hypothetical protein